MINLLNSSDVPPVMRTELLERKLNQCCVLFDFTDPKLEQKQKGILILCILFSFVLFIVLFGEESERIGRAEEGRR